jgi:GNAT superfamily N-acetyltransferase
LIVLPSRFEVRQVRYDEWCAIKDVRLAMLRDSPRAFATTITEALAHDDQVWIDRAVAGALGEAQWTVLAFDSETPIGMGVGLRRARFGKPILVVVSVFLAESFRGTGVTDEMFRQIEEWGCSWGAMYASLWVGDENARAAAFYRRSGYAITLDRAKLPNNSGLWETRLEKALMSPT